MISEFLVAYITIVASDWPRTFFTPKVFLFSISFNRPPRAQTIDDLNLIAIYGETAAQFLAELRNLAWHCDYGRSISDILRDHLVCRINDGKIQQRLLAKKELTLKRTWEIIQAIESADKYPDVGEATACAFKKAECYACRKKGHIAKVCCSKSKLIQQQGM